MFIELSYALSESTPFYKGLRGPSVEQLYDLRRGDACNSFYLTTSNHAGTHVDGPNHFDPDGRRICDYHISELVFTKPALIDVPVERDGLILPEDCAKGASGCRSDCDILFIRSGFGSYRSQRDMYVEHGPGLSGSAADFLMQRFGQLKALAVDFVSVASMSHMDEGQEAHRIFLGCGKYHHRPVLLIEDVRLPEILPPLRRVYLVPLFFEGLDSAPCTLFGESGENA